LFGRGVGGRSDEDDRGGGRSGRDGGHAARGR
jgi:hypothetical protein